MLKQKKTKEKYIQAIRSASVGYSYMPILLV